MNPSFGALVAYRRRSLGLTQAQLAYRMAAYGNAVDIPLLERGDADLSQHATRTTLTIALEWPMGLVEAAGSDLWDIATDAHPLSHVRANAPNLSAEDMERTIREELVILRELRTTLDQWLGDLERRVLLVLIDGPTPSRAVRFND